MALPVDAPGPMLGVGLFETMRVGGRGGLPLWERHLARLAGSARAFGLPAPAAGPLRDAALELVRAAGVGAAVLRMTLLDDGGDGLVVMTTRGRGGSAEPLSLWLSSARRSGADPTAAHKTTSRAFWRLARHGAPGGPVEVLVAGDDGGVLETETGNLFAEVDGRWVTPPAGAGILPGVARALVLEGLRAAGVAVDELRLGVDELARAARIAVTNAVHGPRAARFGAGEAGGAGIDDLRAVWDAACGG